MSERIRLVDPATGLDYRAGDYYADIAEGKIKGAIPWNALGHNPDVDQGASLPEDIWEGGGIYNWMTGATSLEILSSSALDTAAGTGARTFTVVGLDINYNQVVFPVTMNGTTPVVFPSLLYRINRIIIASAGSLGFNAGTITVRNAGGGLTRSIIPVTTIGTVMGYGINRSSAYTVPRGKTLYITKYTMSINRPSTARDCTLVGVIRAPQGHAIMTSDISVDGNPFDRELTPPLPVLEMHDFNLRAVYVSADNTDITAAWSGYVKDN